MTFGSSSAGGRTCHPTGRSTSPMCASGHSVRRTTKSSPSALAGDRSICCGPGLAQNTRPGGSARCVAPPYPAPFSVTSGDALPGIGSKSIVRSERVRRLATIGHAITESTAAAIRATRAARRQCVVLTKDIDYLFVRAWRKTIPRLANPAPGTALAAAKRTPAQPVMASAVTESAGLQRSERSERSRQAACYVHGRTPFHGDLEERAGCWKPDYSAACQADALRQRRAPSDEQVAPWRERTGATREE